VQEDGNGDSKRGGKEQKKSVFKGACVKVSIEDVGCDTFKKGSSRKNQASSKMVDLTFVGKIGGGQPIERSEARHLGAGKSPHHPLLIRSQRWPLTNLQ